MTLSSLFSKASLVVASASFATAAFAHPALLSSAPADQSQGPAPAKIELNFSETLTPQFSGAHLIKTGMPGMPNHGAMKIKARVSGANDGKTMVITPASPLPAGDYRLEWRAVSSDTHPVKGSLTFRVK